MRKPEEITSYELKKGRGYRSEDVDEYLRSVSADYRTLYLENQSLKEKLLLVNNKLLEYVEREQNRLKEPQERMEGDEPSFAQDEVSVDQLHEFARQNEEIRKRLLDKEEKLNKKCEDLRESYLKFFEKQLEMLHTPDFLFETDDVLSSMEIPKPVDIEVSVNKERAAKHKESRENKSLFQMLNQLNQQMKEESDAQVINKVKESSIRLENELSKEKSAPEKDEISETSEDKKEKETEKNPKASDTKKEKDDAAQKGKSVPDTESDLKKNKEKKEADTVSKKKDHADTNEKEKDSLDQTIIFEPVHKTKGDS